MRKVAKLIYVITVLLFIFSCVSKKDSTEKSFDLKKYQKAGDEVSSIAQATLIQNLSAAIEKGGAEYAVQFCNLNASGLLDSVSSANNCVISRLTDQNRNTGNFISSPEDKAVWQDYKNRNSENAQADSVLQLADNIIYYRPIRIGMPTCLKCHGSPDVDIDGKTLTLIDSLYPKDLAKNYKSGDLRGLWKIEFISAQQE